MSGINPFTSLTSGWYHGDIRHWEPRLMKIHLPPELEKIVNEELKIGHFRTVEEVIAEALQALREREKSSPASGGNEARREAVREMLDFVENNRACLKDVTVKELIHEGHRL
jgi:putative addiction module CopG family antidote